MSAQFTLDAIREAAEAKYGATEIVVDDKTTVRMLNPLRLPKTVRDALVAIREELTAEGADQAEIFRKCIVLVSEEEAKARILVDAVGDDLALLAEIFRTYTEGTSVGEASPSAD
jgi:hypothetical protein